MPVKAALRFYEELNDYLPPEQRKVGFSRTFGDGASVRTVLAAVGVPEQLVDLVLVNGDSASLDQRVANGDRISVYPVFESLDVSELARLHDRPLRNLRFVVDTRLGRLATYLRMLGFDTLVGGAGGDMELVEISKQHERILLTRNQRLLERHGLTRVYRVAAAVPRRQLAEVLWRFDLARAVRPFRRCLRCNTPVEVPAEAERSSRPPRGIQSRHARLPVCPGCGTACWRGRHFRRMRCFVDAVLRAVRTPASGHV
jgi:uncharacterized protein with PIN domain